MGNPAAEETDCARRNVGCRENHEKTDEGDMSVRGVKNMAGLHLLPRTWECKQVRKDKYENLDRAGFNVSTNAA